eukprot:TRINITY_DN15319_c0_g1_i1.p1 TRINITY_DN15319_c0_g1~~TRINITY_DN15319_c0_g1_i1.p1  ORF type:complete len:501 (-),score=99.08 TRINITY_DN15319_c0_g1_i1:16-1518(-)
MAPVPGNVLSAVLLLAGLPRLRGQGQEDAAAEEDAHVSEYWPWSWNVSRALRRERLRAEERWRQGRGFVWFQHYRRAGGTTLCQLLQYAVPVGRLAERAEACQPDEWRLKDAMKASDHNSSLLLAELVALGGNIFAQEYGTMPGPTLLGHRTQSSVPFSQMVFVATMRDPWKRFWSQLKYELATCMSNPRALAACVGGNFQAIGQWWSLTAHEDSVLGIPGYRIGESPELYVDNYYTRILLNRTDTKVKLQPFDLERAMMLLRERMSAIIVLEDFAKSALQLVCALGMDLEQAKPYLRTRVRPYEIAERFVAVPQKEDHYGTANIEALKGRFMKKNRYDYALWNYAKRLSQHRLYACAQRHPAVRQAWKAPPNETEDVYKGPEPVKEGDPLPEEVTVDDLFGCNGGRVDFDNNTGQYLLFCPRSAAQHANSWWKSQMTDGVKEPHRKKGERAVGSDCWLSGFSYPACCGPKFGPQGNPECWGEGYTYERCCQGKKSSAAS